jgi:hypothetical protein
MIYNDFTLSGYQEILKSAKENGYSFSSFDTINQETGFTCLLRHDVDADVKAALNMAKVEFDLGVSSTFFFMTRSSVYNLFSILNSKMVNEIIKLNHHIGLHFDASYISNQKLTINEAIGLDVKYLGQHFNVPITTVSFHQPSQGILSNEIKVEKFINTYDKKYFENIHYISDSNKTWKQFHPKILFKEKAHSKIQLLIHPMWWNSKESLTTSAIWDLILLDNISRTQDFLHATEGAYPSPKKIGFI